MDNVGRDDVLHALKYCYEFYRKPFEDIDKQVWGGMIRDHNYSSFQWKEEIRNYMGRGTFCPKPKEILGALAENHERKVHKESLQIEEMVDDCPPEIRKAWSHWIPVFHGQALPFDSTNEEADEGLIEAWLLLVNEEAKRVNSPESIPDDFKMKEIWGA
jgi:hypothetical protein